MKVKVLINFMKFFQHIKKVKINNILIEKYKDMLEYIDFEHNCCSIASTGIYRIGHDIIRLMRWLAYYDTSSFENVKYYDLMGSVLRFLNEIS